MQDLLATLAVADIDAVDGNHAAPMEPFGKQRHVWNRPERRGRVHGIRSRFHVLTESVQHVGCRLDRIHRSGMCHNRTNRMQPVLEIGDEAAVTGAEARHVMAAAANRYEQIVVACEPERLQDVRNARAPEHRTITAGRLSISPFQTRRAWSYSPQRSTSTRPARRSANASITGGSSATTAPDSVRASVMGGSQYGDRTGRR